MDGVIVNTMPDHYSAWQKVFQSLGIQVDTYEIYRREGEPGMVTVSEILAMHGKHFEIKGMQKLLQQKETLFKETASPALFPGIEHFIEELDQRGFRLALVTGTSRSEMESILPSRIHRFFEYVVTGDSIERGKPAPDSYLKALEGLKIKADEALVIENAPYGIQSAKGAGLLCIAITTSLPGEYLQDADFICDSLKKVRELLLGQAL